jgi:3-phenylpropionate/trans-cinnamate dioxygenase ferredoxin reductase component
MSAGIVIVGAGMAGQSAARGLRAAGYAGPLTVLGEEVHMPYDRPPLSKAAIADEAEPTPAWLLDDATAAALNADWRCGRAAESIDRASKTVRLSDGGTVSYEKLLLTTGSRPRRLTVPGAERALLLRTYEDAVALRRKLRSGACIVIIGGGFIGLELAASAVKRGCKVTVIEAQPRILMRGVPEPIARIIHARHLDAGVALLTGVGLHSIDQAAVHLADGREVAADAVVVGIGVLPETRLAEAAGLVLANGIAVDATLKTSDPDIFAAGDCCAFPHPLLGGAPLRLESWRNALDQGAFVAENLLGAGKEYRAVPWFWSDQHDLSLQVAGLPGAGSVTIARKPTADSLMLFHLTADGVLVGASGIGVGNAVARDIKLAEMLIARQAKPDAVALATPSVALKSLLKAG